MKKKPTLWKQRCMAAERVAEALRVEKELGETLLREQKGVTMQALAQSETHQRNYEDQRMKNGNLYEELSKRPTVERFVEVEVLPLWVAVLLISMLLGEVIGGWAMLVAYDRLSDPIVRPYAVTVYKNNRPTTDVPCDEGLADKLKECQSEWRQMKKREARRLDGAAQ
jgi:hypothetical protein